MKAFTTPKGTQLPIMEVDGKPYLKVAYRIQWFIEENSRYDIDTKYAKLDDNMSLVQATIIVYDENGSMVRRAQASKTGRHDSKNKKIEATETAETGAIGRALAMLGYGTQFTANELDEGDQLADAPLDEQPKEKQLKKTKEVVEDDDNSDQMFNDIFEDEDDKPKEEAPKKEEDPQQKKRTRGFTRQRRKK